MLEKMILRDLDFWFFNLLRDGIDYVLAKFEKKNRMNNIMMIMVNRFRNVFGLYNSVRTKIRKTCV